MNYASCRSPCLDDIELRPRTQKRHILSQATLGSMDELCIHQGQLFSCSQFAGLMVGKAAGQMKLFWGKHPQFPVFAAKVGLFSGGVW